MAIARKDERPAGKPALATDGADSTNGWPAILLVVAVVLVWSHTFNAPFVLDDNSSILNNPSIRDLATLDWARPPATGGETVSGRPVLNLTFAINHALGGTAVFGYRLVNVLLHACAALALHGVIRRTLALHRAGAPGGMVCSAPKYSDSWAAGAVALCWAVHPLQTATVSYVAQRAELLASLFLLLTLYCFIRSVGRPTRSGLWAGTGVLTCALGMATKETMVGAPLLVLLLDRIFVSGSFRGAWRERGRTHAALAGTWLLLAALVWQNHGRGGSAGFGTQIDPWTYFLTQCDAIPRYVGLVFWPAGLVFDHGMPTAGGLGAVWPGLLVLSVAGAASVWALSRGRVEGFLGAGFFLLLAPSSSFVPVATQTVAEHRMYLPSAIVVLLAGLLVRRVRTAVRPRWLTPVLVGLVVLSLGTATWARNRVYRTAQALWLDTVAKRPDSPRARVGLGQALLTEAGDAEQAIVQFRKALELQSNHPLAHYNLGTALLMQRRFAEAVPHLEAAIGADPAGTDARLNLGQALTGLGRAAEAAEQYRLVLARDPAAPDAAINLGALLITAGQAGEGEALLRRALAAAPELAEAHYHLGRAQEQRGDFGAAEASYRTAIGRKPSFAPAQVALAHCLTRRGDLGGAESALREALRLDPGSAEAHYATGNLRARRRDFAGAMAAYRATLEIAPEHVPARANLGNCQLVTGRLREAISTYEEVLRRRPGEPAALRNLALAREQLGE